MRSMALCRVPRCSAYSPLSACLTCFGCFGCLVMLRERSSAPWHYILPRMFRVAQRFLRRFTISGSSPNSPEVLVLCALGETLDTSQHCKVFFMLHQIHADIRIPGTPVFSPMLHRLHAARSIRQRSADPTRLCRAQRSYHMFQGTLRSSPELFGTLCRFRGFDCFCRSAFAHCAPDRIPP